MSYKLKIDLSKLEEHRTELKNGFLNIHNGLVNIEKALEGVEGKGYKGEAAKSIEELMNVIKSDVIAPTDKYNDLVVSDLNAASQVFNDL
jgi:hypothetical protein